MAHDRTFHRNKARESDGRPPFAPIDGDSREILVHRLGEAIRAGCAGTFRPLAQAIVDRLLAARPVWPANGNGPGKGGVVADRMAEILVEAFPSVRSEHWLAAEEANTIPDSLWDHPTRGHEARVRHWMNETFATAHALKFDRERGGVLDALKG